MINERGICETEITFRQIRFLLAEGIIWTLALFVVWWWRNWWLQFWPLIFPPKEKK